MNVYVSRAGIGPLHHARRRSLSEVLRHWYQRSQDRRHLAELDDRLLKDLALDRAQVQAEAAKPFWRA